jgi:hypothetical protein
MKQGDRSNVTTQHSGSVLLILKSPDRIQYRARCQSRNASDTHLGGTRFTSRPRTGYMLLTDSLFFLNPVDGETRKHIVTY